MISSLLSVALLATSAVAAPAPSLGRRAVPAQVAGDAPYTQDESVYQKAITCPDYKGRAGGIVFLVHGTGSTGSESWANGPYNVFLPTKGKGYDICWVDLPSRSVADAQLSAEYVAYGIDYLYRKGGNKQIAVIGHSQGAGCNPQWALAFWPSKRPYVRQYIGLAPDWHGTAEGALLCAGSTAVGGCEPSVWQQSVGSKYLAAQNSHKDTNSGAQALVPTSSLYTLTDDVIQPEIITPTSVLSGASNLALQDPRVCGPTHLADHFSMIIDPAAFGLAFNALESNTPVNAATLDKRYCTYFVDDAAANFTNTAAFLRSAFLDVVTIASYPKVATEPPLQPYVCTRGYNTTTCASQSGFPNNYVR